MIHAVPALLCLEGTSLAGVIKLCSKEHPRYKQIILPSPSSSPLLFVFPFPLLLASRRILLMITGRSVWGGDRQG